MVLYGIRAQTQDIDLGCTSSMADLLEQQGYPITHLPDGTRRISCGEDVEIFENWVYDTVQFVSGFPVISLPGLIEMKKYLGREKDQHDIQLVQAFITKTRQSI